jgi:hypothetical protein
MMNMNGRHDVVALRPEKVIAATRPEKVAVICNECGRKWKVSANAATLECAKCGGVDIDVR